MKKRTIYKISGVLWIVLIVIGLILIAISNNSITGRAKYDFMYIVDSIGVITLVLSILTLIARVIMFLNDRTLPPIFFKGPITKAIEKHKIQKGN